MRGNARNLGFEQRDTVSQFVLRIGIEELSSQVAGRIALGAGTIIEFHHS